MDEHAGEDERHGLVMSMQTGEGTVAEAEAWLSRLKEIDPYFSCSDSMLQLEIAVRGRSLFGRMVAENRASPSHDQLVALVQSIMNLEGSEEEHHAKLVYLRAAVSDPYVIDYIYWPPNRKEMSAEEVVDRALSYKPIEL